jgi:hypothetical protein
MSLSDDLAPMHTLTDSIRDDWSGEGHAIVEALDKHEAFTADGRPQSALGRSLLMALVRRNASRSSVMVRTARGGGVEILLDLDDRVLVFRVRRAHRDPDTGAWVVLAPSSGELPPIDTEETLKPHHRWVFAFVLGQGDDLLDVFAAPVDGVSDHRVPRLLLGPEIALGTVSLTPPPTGGFIPSDEDLDDDNDISALDDTEEGPSRVAGA